MQIGKGNKSYFKAELENERSESPRKRYVFAHKATAGQTVINLAALTVPPEMAANGFSNPTAAQIGEAHIKLYRGNLSLTSSLRNKLIDYLSYTVDSATQISLVGLFQENGSPGAEEGEIFVGELEVQPQTPMLMVDASPILATGTLAAGQTDIAIGVPIETGKYLVEGAQVGAVMLIIDGKLQLRNVANAAAAPSADGNYEEVPAGGGLTNLLRVNASAAYDRAYAVIGTFGNVERPEGSMIAAVEATLGAVNSMKATLAALAGVPESTFGTTPSTVDLKVFGNMVLALNARVAAQKVFIGTPQTNNTLGLTNTSYATPANPIALTMTPVLSGKYKIYTSFPLQQNGAGARIDSKVLNSVGGATILADNRDETALAAGSEPMHKPYIIAQLVAGTSYTFTAQLRNVSGISTYNVVPGNQDGGATMIAELVE